jgi:hypothetical protein
MRYTTRYPLDQVREMVQQFITQDEDGVFTLEAVTMRVNTALNGTHDLFDQGTDGQVRRYMGLLVRDGRLIKVGRRETGPDGRPNHGRQPVFYTPEAYAKAEADHEESERVRWAIEARWKGIYDALSAMDIHPVTRRGQGVRLSSATWDVLLGRLRNRD